MKTKEIDQVSERILALYCDQRVAMRGIALAQIHELRHRADEARLSRLQPWSYRAAAEIVFAACELELEARNDASATDPRGTSSIPGPIGKPANQELLGGIGGA